MAVHHAVGISCQKNSGYHSLLRQMAAQKQEKHSSKIEKYTPLQKKNQNCKL